MQSCTIIIKKLIITNPLPILLMKINENYWPLLKVMKNNGLISLLLSVMESNGHYFSLLFIIFHYFLIDLHYLELVLTYFL